MEEDFIARDILCLWRVRRGGCGSGGLVFISSSIPGCSVFELFYVLNALCNSAAVDYGSGPFLFCLLLVRICIKMTLFVNSVRRTLSTNTSISLKICSFWTGGFQSFEKDQRSSAPAWNRSHEIKLPQIMPSGRGNLEKDFRIEVVNTDLLGVSLSSMEPSTPMDGDSEALTSSLDVNDEPFMKCLDFDEIEDLRLHKRLFYKLDKGSKECEEHNLNFHRKKSVKKCHNKTSVEVDSKKEHKELEKKQNQKVVKPKMAKTSEPGADCPLIKSGGVDTKLTIMEGKRVRMPTYNQLTDPYHLPFCLDIYISKASVRACIVHRVTSKVVAVAHSISKDMKFDLKSRKDSTACAAVGGILAQRAIEDDIHNVIYTPRKGEKIEGKIQIVLQSIIDHGVDVKVKLKQKRPAKVGVFFKSLSIITQKN
ncbi:hypothetical protein Cni_G16841 [Canna indica]|uniref:Ribosomal protein L18 n=1 Tax=Canna indica TaxID=4628 RepID=A0AAQ3KGQ0_9LILI|nr:hypothetical protein Cni_G16841 [Canna indica]